MAPTPFELRIRLLARAGALVAVLVALSAAGGLWLPSVYARETASWTAQGLGQDWVDLCIVAPVLAWSAYRVGRGSRAAQLVLGGALMYTIYSFVLYALAMHFNVLFLVYCATLGTASFSLAGLAHHLRTEDVPTWFRTGVVHARLAGGFLIGVACAFGLLWLFSVIPALLRGADPPGLAETGLATNPVYVLDLSLVLPAMIVAGVAVLRRRPLGLAAAPVLLAFNVLMALALVGMIMKMHRAGLPADLRVAMGMGVVALASAVILALFLRQLAPPSPPSGYRSWIDEPRARALNS